ncbi:MAG: molybdopterin-guanine dinucleotide biosynthesis protein B [Syntrophobacteraceae bacterium]
MIPIVCVVGASDSGKTTFLEQLIPELTSRGYRVGTIKHDAHGFEMDREGKDTWRHRRAGAATIAISSPTQVATIRGTAAEMELSEVVSRYFWAEDLVLAEGFKRSHFPKIEVFRKAIEPAPICAAGDNLLALVTDDDPLEPQVPHYGFRNVSGVADLIESRFLKDRKEARISVHVDGKRLPMNEFVQDFVIGTVHGMLSTLRGWKTPKSLSISIRFGDE